MAKTLKRLGCYLTWRHSEDAFLPYIKEAYQRGHMRHLRNFQVDYENIRRIYQHCPDTIFFPRIHAWSDDDLKYNRMLQDPEGTGQHIADLWWGRINEWFQRAKSNGERFPDLEQIVPVGINEPNQTNRPVEISLCDLAFLRRLRSYSSLLRGCSLNLSVGNPGELHNGISDWRPYQDNLSECERYGHYLTLHEYWRKEGPDRPDDAGWLAWRHEHVVRFGYRGKILIGECGHDRILYNDSAGHGGWMDYEQSLGVSHEQAKDIYISQLATYTRRCHPNVVAVLPFLTDYEDNSWHSFDTVPLHSKILARLHEFETTIEVAPPITPLPGGGHTIYLPSIPGGNEDEVEPVNKILLTTDALNLRYKPDVNAAIYKTVPRGTQLKATGGSKQWYRVEYEGQKLWAHGNWLVETKEPGDDFDRAIRILAEIEGGYSSDPNDPGNWTGGKVGEGVLKGTNFGISAGAYPNLDIKNLTYPQAVEIYRRDYWKYTQGLTWPMNLVHFDAAVNHGPGTAQRFLNESNGDVYEYLAKRIHFFTQIKNWPRYGIGWMRRIARVMEEING